MTALAKAAAKFHMENPHVYTRCAAIARSLKQKGFTHYGIKAIFEVLRYEAIQTHGDRFKLNNNYHAWYARELMAKEPDLAGFFCLRGTHS